MWRRDEITGTAGFHRGRGQEREPVGRQCIIVHRDVHTPSSLVSLWTPARQDEPVLALLLVHCAHPFRYSKLIALFCSLNQLQFQRQLSKRFCEFYQRKTTAVELAIPCEIRNPIKQTSPKLKATTGRLGKPKLHSQSASSWREGSVPETACLS